MGPNKGSAELLIEDFESLLVLLKAPSKEFVADLLKTSFLYRSSLAIPSSAVQQATETLKVTCEQSEKLLVAVSKLVRTALYTNMDRSTIIGIFPENFHKSLKELLVKIISENLPDWKSEAILNQVSLPRLTDFIWRVDVKSASQDVSRMSAPSCLVQLRIDDSTGDNNGFIKHVNVELSRETLDTMLDGLGRIRDQLQSVVSR